MKFSEIAARVGGIPHMLPWQGEFVYRLILENDIEQVLELGVAHGTSALYMAAALHEKGCGKVIAIDRQQALSLNPNIIELSKKTGLDEFIEPVFAHTTYNWELMKLLEQHSEPFLDFCYLDGAHNFETDTCAFFLIDRLLKPGGCILFDDVSWSYAKSATLKNELFVEQLSTEERETPHIQKLIDLVVRSHPSYEIILLDEQWQMAEKSVQKTSSAQIRKLYRETGSATFLAKQLLKKILGL